MPEPFVLTDPAEIERVRGWIRDGRGLYRWKSQEFGTDRPDILTPGDVTHAPHWAYVGQPLPVTPEELLIEKVTVIQDPPEWHPECQHCKGSGRRSVERLADIRGESVKKTREFLKTTGTWGPMDESEETFACNYCNGTGHEISRVTGRVKRAYWGSIVFGGALNNRARSHAMKLKEHYGLQLEVIPELDYIQEGMIGVLQFVTREPRPFTME